MADDATWGPLGEGEELLFEGGARGRPPLRLALPLYLMVGLFPFLLGAMLLFAAWKTERAGSTWHVGWTQIEHRWTDGKGSSSATSAPGPLFGPKVEVPVVGAVTVPWLLLWLAGAAGCEVLRLARWRSHALAVTTRRLLHARGVVQRTRTQHERAGGETVQPGPFGTTEVHGLAGGAWVAIPGLDQGDRTALRSALARFEPGPTPPPPPPVVTWRRVAALALVLLLGLALAWRSASEPGRVTVVVRRPGAASTKLLVLEVDSPTRSGLRVAPMNRPETGETGPWETGTSGAGSDFVDGPAAFGQRLELLPLTITAVELDGVPWRPSGVQLGYRHEGRRLRSRTELTLADEKATIAAEQVRVVGVLHTVDGTALPFEVTLPSPGEATLDLSPR